MPAEWRSFPTRYIGRRQGRLEAARITRVVVARGMDPCFGFLHDGRKPGRLSLVWDCVELHRPELVRVVFGFAEGRAFQKSDFRLIDGGVVRLAPPIMKEVATLAIGAIPLKDMVKTVEWMAKQIRKVT